MKKVIEEHSIVSFGISIMKNPLASSPVVHPTIEPKYSQSYECDNYNFLTLKEGPLVFGPGNAQFLATSGFSIDRLIQEGIPFVPPGDIQKENQEEQLHAPVKDTKLIQLWRAILGILKYNNIPLILHNGLHDIMYLYHSFIDRLPKKFSSFVNSVSNYFPSGIYDTKYLAAELNFNATFLSYVFARSDRLRQNRFIESTEKEPYFEVIVNHPAQQQPNTSATKKIKLDDAPSFDDDNDEKKLKKQKKKDVICKAYAHVLDWEMGVSQYPQTYTSDFTQEDAIEGAHSAHFDAYMTAFSFCYFLHTFPPVKLQEKINKIKLDFMEHPLRFPFKK
ncbi:MAG: ribonuclease CAF1 [Benjaminiella poitrasii]|nr:MAG: ribonuclease CAF1 [Benjaminiella poitrasii]